jgi:chorismate dehydratase
MSASPLSYPLLSKLRIGCVRYLNSRPLIHAFPGPVLYEHPSKLARLMAENELDLALIPTFDILRNPEYRVADGVAIASLGEVYSVFLAYQGELKSIETIQADPASMTSVNLVQVLLREFHGLTPQLNGKASAELLIGNQAIEFRKTQGDRYCYLDLGEEWRLRTGLPFVFAAWALRPGVPGEAAEELRQLKEESGKLLEEIIQSEPDPEFTRRYLTQNIRFDLGQREKEAIRLFGELLGKHGLAHAPARPSYL